MTVRLISTVTALGVIFIYLMNVLAPGAPLFLFASDNDAVNITRLALAVIVVALSFKQGFTYRFTHTLSVLTGGTLFGLGLAGLLITFLDNVILTSLKPVDFMVAMELGIAMTICNFSYENRQLELPLKVSAKKLIPSFTHRLPLPKPRAAEANS